MQMLTTYPQFSVAAERFRKYYRLQMSLLSLRASWRTTTKQLLGFEGDGPGQF
jgi:hypothetical protein